MINITKSTGSFALFLGAFSDYYNPQCFERTDVDDTPENRDIILNLHRDRHYLFQQMRETPATDLQQLAMYRDTLQQLEFNLQAAWGFDQDENFHTYWFRAPHCTCPKMDNSDQFGSEIKYISADCPLHGIDSINGRWGDEEIIQEESGS